MQFSDTSGKQGIIEDITFHTGIDTTQYPTADRTRNVNRWYLRAVDEMLKADAEWEFDDTDKSDLPVLTTTLVASQEDYELPKSLTTNATTLQGGSTAGGILKIHSVEVKDAAGIYQPLKQFDIRDLKGLSITEYKKTAGMPSEYDIRGNTLFLKCPPAAGSVTLSAGLKIYITREPYVFVAADTTREPGFAEQFHRLLSYGASFDWFIAKAPNKAPGMKVLIDEMIAGLKAFYGSRNRDKKQRLKPRSMTRSHAR